ncbi:MAG: 16S rRNA (adenine(1518)-N(6)/adenine(1519)-N(6))-dimethyltransferase RsmA [Patescibacteria group bacterium]
MFYPKKSLGQNFLIDLAVLPKIIQAAGIKKGETVLEIGPGFGILTQAILASGAQVFAVEKDFQLVEKLRESIKNKNLTIIHQDALFFDPSNLKSYKLVANLPFSIASPIVRKFLENPNQPEIMVVMVQKEVAKKIIAKPGDSQRGVLTLAVEFYGQAEIIAEVNKNSFHPQPKIDAAIIKIKPYKDHRVGGLKQVEPKLFFRLVRAGFSSKRRQIHNSLAATLRLSKPEVKAWLEKSNINPQLRAEDLTLTDWLNLSQHNQNLST